MKLLAIGAVLAVVIEGWHVVAHLAAYLESVLALDPQ